MALSELITADLEEKSQSKRHRNKDRKERKASLLKCKINPLAALKDEGLLDVKAKEFKRSYVKSE